MIRQTVGAVDYFVVAEERGMSDCIKKLSDYRPAAVPSSLWKIEHDPTSGDAVEVDSILNAMPASNKARLGKGAGRSARDV